VGITSYTIILSSGGSTTCPRPDPPCSTDGSQLFRLLHGNRVDDSMGHGYRDVPISPRYSSTAKPVVNRRTRKWRARPGFPLTRLQGELLPDLRHLLCARAVIPERIPLLLVVVVMVYERRPVLIKAI
jgi:hypothetical protein